MPTVSRSPSPPYGTRPLAPQGTTTTSTSSTLPTTADSATTFSPLPQANLNPDRGRSSVARMLEQSSTANTSLAKRAWSPSKEAESSKRRHLALAEELEEEVFSDSEDEDDIENRLLDEESHPELYALGESATSAQLSYLAQHGQRLTAITEVHSDEFNRHWDEMIDSEKLTAVGMYEGAKAIELTDPGTAIGSANAGPCLLGFAQATINDNGTERTFGAAIHVDPTALGIGTIDVVEGYLSVFKPLHDALKHIQPDISELQFSLRGGDRETPESVRLAAAVVHAAEDTEINLVNCKVPMNNNHQITSAYMTKDALVHMTEEI